MSKNNVLNYLGIDHVGEIYYQLEPAELIEQAIKSGQGVLANNGALVIRTGEFTGRSPKDKFVVEDPGVTDKIWWGEVNQKFPRDKFDVLFEKVKAYLQNKTLYVRDGFAGADPEYRIGVRVITEFPWQSVFAYNMFIRPTREELRDFTPDWTVISIPSYYANSDKDGTRQHNFTIVDLKNKLILIGGSGYTGEIKKGIFTIMNYLLPEQGVLSMHCSANVGEKGDVALFFGLSGTGKTTLSSDPNRKLIGDDEHGWTDKGVFNIEGGCYAKIINLSKEKEPLIWNAIKFNALVENVNFIEGTREIDFADESITPNTRVSYPIYHIDNVVLPSVGGVPRNIFFLTADAYGVLPPISKLTPEQAMYHFISGYTSKIAGTEEGIIDPVATFSACFGEPFLPLHPTRYAEMLGEKMQKHNVNIWLVNTGWIKGPFGVGHRIDLPYTRAMITAAINGDLDNVEYITDPIFGLHIPKEVPGVPADILNPAEAWSDKNKYQETAQKLARKFVENFKNYEDFASEAVKNAGPKV